MIKEIICLNFGQAGVQISDAIWELFCIEHGLDCQGKCRSNSSQDDFFSGLYSIFQEGQSHNFAPRAINLDLEPTVIDEIRLGPYRNLWQPDMLISGLEDASNNYARGYFTIGKRMIADFIVQLTKLVRNCNHLHGFVLVNSYGGGTGSGFSNLVLDYMDTEFGKKTKVGTVIFPSSRMSTAVVEPYNCILAAISSIEIIDLALLFDNEAIFDCCFNKLNICEPTYTTVNRIVSQVVSSLTVTLRFGSSLDHDLTHLQTNLIPYPQMHFPFVAFSPMMDQSKIHHHNMSTVSVTHDLFDPSSQLIKCNVSIGKYMSCCLQYRGCVLPKEVNSALQEIKKNKHIQFVDWCPTGFKVGISPMPPISSGSFLAMSNKNCTMFCNSTAIEQVWNRLHLKFRCLYRKRSFLHWYVAEGIEESEFDVLEDRVIRLQKDYQEIGGVLKNEVIIEPKGLTVSNSNNAISKMEEHNGSCLLSETSEISTSNSTISDDRRNEMKYILKTMKTVKTFPYNSSKTRKEIR